MKIKLEHYNQLLAGMKKVKELHPQSTPQSYAEEKIGKDTAMRFRWDALRAAQNLGAPGFDEFYMYLNDSHIDTALRRAVSEIYG